MNAIDFYDLPRFVHALDVPDQAQHAVRVVTELDVAFGGGCTLSKTSV